MVAVAAAVSLVALLMSAKGFNLDDAQALAHLEGATYCDAERFNKWDVGDQLYSVDAAKVRLVQDVSTEATAGIGRMLEPDGCFVAVRGTNGVWQSILDADFVTAKWDRPSCQDCWLHAGFMKSYESIRTRVFDTLEEFGCQNKPLYLTGHSFGAAVMHYLLYDAIAASYSIARATAMESPRPGDQGFAVALQKILATQPGADVVRITHYQDLVPHVPPYHIANYRHSLPEIYFGTRNGSGYKECGLDDNTSNCANQWPLWDLTMDDHCWFADMSPCGCPSSGTSSGVGQVVYA